MPKGRIVPLLTLAFAACQPPATDNYVERNVIPAPRQNASEPLDSPDVQGAVWAEAQGQARLVYGKPGMSPLFAIACVETLPEPRLRLTRYAPADVGAKAFMALVGNGHVARLKVDATRSGDGYLWQGETPISNDRLEALTGARALEATVPGAGTLKLNPSHLPGQLIERCRAEAKATALPAPAKSPA